MGIKLTPEVLAAAYDLLLTLEPFSEWNLPPSEDIKFKVDKSLSNRGWYLYDNGKHTIGVSQRCCGHIKSLMAVMCHEAIHLHQQQNCLNTKAEHNKAFKIEADKISADYGFDPCLF